MKYLFLWLLLTTACCLITIHIFSLTLVPSQTRQNALRLITSKASSLSEAILRTKDEETQTGEVAAEKTADNSAAATTQEQAQTSALARKHWYWSIIATREMMLVVTFANPMFLGGVIGIAAMIFKFVYGERVLD